MDCAINLGLVGADICMARFQHLLVANLWATHRCLHKTAVLLSMKTQQRLLLFPWMSYIQKTLHNLLAELLCHHLSHFVFLDLPTDRHRELFHKLDVSGDLEMSNLQ